MYVALSRVTSLQGLYLIGKFNIAAISSDESVKREYEYLRENQSLNMLEIDTAVLDNNLVLTVSNVRSLIRHVNDIKSDMVMVSSDLILCTETQLGLLFENTVGDEIKIPDFSLSCNNAAHKFSSLAFYYRHANILFRHVFMTEGFSIVEVVKEDFAPSTWNILLLYRKKDLPIKQYLECLSYLVESRKIHVIVGDFNLKPNVELRNILQQYEQLVVEPTHISGSLLDHAYIRQDVLDLFYVEVTVKTLFFSDHDAVRIVIQNKLLG